MNEWNYICIGVLAVSLGTLTSCQKTQTASAQQVAAQLGENPAPVGAGGQVEAGKVAEVGTPPGAAPLSQTPANSVSLPDGGRNRFGFSGGGSEGMVKPLRREKEASQGAPAEKEEEKKRVADSTGKPPSPSGQSNPSVVDLGFASFMPNDKLHVKLPGEYEKLGSVSVERIDPSGRSQGSAWPRGTQMQIPNPNVPGGKIYFKVP